MIATCVGCGKTLPCTIWRKGNWCADCLNPAPTPEERALELENHVYGGSHGLDSAQVYAPGKM